MEIRIAGTSNDSIVDGPGIRFTIFVQGCPHHCKGCHNPQTHSYDGGKVIDTDELLEKILANPLLDGVTFSGGEPFVYAKQLADLARKIKQNNLNIVTYSGYTFERLISEKCMFDANKSFSSSGILLTFATVTIANLPK